MMDLILNTILFAGDRMNVKSTEDEMQRAVYARNNLAIKYDLKISVSKTKTMDMNEKMEVRILIIENHTIVT